MYEVFFRKPAWTVAPLSTLGNFETVASLATVKLELFDIVICETSRRAHEAKYSGPSWPDSVFTDFRDARGQWRIIA